MHLSYFTLVQTANSPRLLFLGGELVGGEMTGYLVSSPLCVVKFNMAATMWSRIALFENFHSNNKVYSTFKVSGVSQDLASRDALKFWCCIFWHFLAFFGAKMHDFCVNAIPGLLVAELFKVLIYIIQIRGLLMSMWPQNDVKSQKMQYLWRLFLYGTEKFCTVLTLITKFHAMSTVKFHWQQNGLQSLSIQM